MRGGQYQVLRLAAGLAGKGFEQVVLAPAGSPLLCAAVGQGLDARPLSVAAAASLARRSDLVHAHDARAHTLGALVSLAPLVVSRRVAFPVRTSVASRWKYARARHYIAVSEFVRSRLVEAGIPGERVSVVYDGVDAAEPSRPAGVVLAVDTSDPKKGTALVAEAARMAGVSVLFTRDLARDLARASLFVYVTFEEGLGSAALMAMAAGVPVVASRVGGLPEAVDDGETGLLVENAPAAIAAAMRRVLDDPALAGRMGARGREQAREKFSTSRMVEGTISVYRRVLS